MKKQFTIFVLSVLFFSVKIQAQTNTFPTTGSAGIGTLTPASSSVLDMTSTTQGMLVPRMTKTQRDAIVTPATGLLIYQTNSTPGFYYYSGTVWTAVSSKGANTTLSNLGTTTSINSALLPNADNTLDLGSSSLRWNEVYTNSIKFLDGTTQSTASTGGGTTYTAGTGISIVGTTISNTGDTNASDDITTSSSASGDVTGLFSNLQIGTGAVGSTEITDGSVSSTDITDGTVSSTDILNATIAAADLSSMGASSGQVMQWNGTAWVATTPTAGSETDPQVGTNTTDKVPKWDGTTLVTGSINDASGRIGLGTINASARGTFRNKLSIFSTEDFGVYGTNESGDGTVYSYGILGYRKPSLVILSPSVTDAGVFGYANSSVSAAAMYALGNSTGLSNYGLVATSTGAGTTNYGVFAKASGATTNYAGYFDGDVQIIGNDETLTIEGTDPYIQMVSGAEDVGYVRADGEDMMLALNAANDDGKVILRTNGVNRMYINDNGDIVMGASTVLPKSGYKLSVDGKVVCEELLVQLAPWPDYVFADEYKLPSLNEVENFIQQHNHLPGIPTASEVEAEGLNVGQMQKLMMEKIEELTLYLIDLQKQNETLKAEIESLKN